MQTRLIRIFGIVQGVGFRPFTSVTAQSCGIRGTVANKGSYVEIFAQGTPEQLDRFAETVRTQPPERAVIMNMEQTDCEMPAYTDFSIIESAHEAGDIFASPDIATCDKCRAELFDPQNRRYLHPFINCTQCGPRLTILDTMPYDRERTSMRSFPMCGECASEYHDPATRRYDAQPVCCNACGPEVYMIGSDLRGGDAITAARQAIMRGEIIAVKGIGGFHLCCDAKNTDAVRRLRERKLRPMKPFAVMLRDPDTVCRECMIQDGQEAWLTGWQKPILLLEKRGDTSLSELIAPDNLTVGVMLPYAPLQMLLFDYPDGTDMTDCLVMTSGNAKGAPICRDDETALRELSGFCDLMLSHNREILLRADDSVCDWLGGAPYMIRRSRGFAPLPVMLKGVPEGQVLGIGGELKNSFCLAKNGLLYASPYVGDTADLRTVQALRESVTRMCGLLETKPERIVCDTHPMYNTVAVAEELAAEWGVPLLKIQHHYAHILSCMAENGVTDRVIGVSFDGTGYGDDGSIWGGELLLCDTAGYVRAGSIRPFMQTGGDASSREGWRIAAALLRETCEDAPALCETLQICDAGAYRVQAAMAQNGINSVRSTSCGRLFDAVAAILGIRRQSTFEGEAATALMYEAERHLRSGAAYPALQCAVTNTDGFVTVETSALAADIARRYAENPAPDLRGALALAFHIALADAVCAACEILRAQSGLQTAALSGGVFQNRLLVQMTQKKLEAAGFTVLRHHLIPPNDGGICLGQAMYGIANKTGSSE